MAYLDQDIGLRMSQPGSIKKITIPDGYGVSIFGSPIRKMQISPPKRLLLREVKNQLELSTTEVSPDRIILEVFEDAI